MTSKSTKMGGSHIDRTEGDNLKSDKGVTVNDVGTGTINDSDVPRGTIGYGTGLADVTKLQNDTSTGSSKSTPDNSYDAGRIRAADITSSSSQTSANTTSEFLKSSKTS